MAAITTRDGVSLYVKDWGRGRPVVLLHGWPMSSDTFDDLGTAIALLVTTPSPEHVVAGH